jgi:hypothetical protein
VVINAPILTLMVVFNKKALNQLAKTQLRNNIKRTIAEQNLNLSKLIQNLEKSMRNSLEQQQY